MTTERDRLPRTGGRLPALIVTDAPGRGHERQSIVVMHLADFEDLHGRARDGAALRRLREALPEGWGFDLVHDQGGTFRCQVWHDQGFGPMTDYERHAATIAEAADKCREALK